MNDDEKRMMSEEYGKDFSGCVWAAIAAVVIVAAIVILFT